MYRKNTDGKLKKYWYALFGTELYAYKSRDDQKHKLMHCLTGVFIEECPKESLDEQTNLWPIKLIYPGNQTRFYYLQDEKTMNEWLSAFKKVLGFTNLYEFYTLGNALGKGKFGLVKEAVHIKTGKKVAVKIIKKSAMNSEDVELQRRELEILKMC